MTISEVNTSMNQCFEGKVSQEGMEYNNLKETILNLRDGPTNEEVRLDN